MPTIQVSQSYSVAAGASLAFVDENAFSGVGGLSTPKLDIAGSVTVQGSISSLTQTGIDFTQIFTNLDVTIETTGVVQVSSTGPAFGHVAAGNLTNHGLLSVSGSRVIATESTVVTNDGTIEATGISDTASAINAQNPFRIINNGLIEAHGASLSTSSYGVVMTGNVGSFLNTGTIIATSSTNIPSIAVYTKLGFNDSFTNSGLLQGDYALQASTTDFNTHIVNNSGTMVGIVQMDEEIDHLINTGTIRGPVYLGAGDDLYDGHLGSVTGMVSGGDGNDSLAGGAGFDNFNGNKGDDTLDGGSGGGDWLVGGQGNDSIVSHASNDILYGNLGNDTLAGGAGDEILRGGQGDDSISGGAGNDWISGDRGNDTLSGGPGADTFHTFSGAGMDVVTDFNASEGDRVQVDPGTIYTVSQQGADVVVDMGNGDEMILKSVQLSSLPANWIFTG